MCPDWEGAAAYGTEKYQEVHEAVFESGFGDHFNTIVTPFQENSDLENIEAVFNSGQYANNWQQRQRIAIDYARTISFLHNSDHEPNPLSVPLVQKDLKVSQFLLGSDLRLLMNDVEAMPPAADLTDLREDLRFMPVVLRKIFGDATMPRSLNQTLEAIYRECEDKTGETTAASILHHLLLAVNF